MSRFPRLLLPVTTVALLVALGCTGAFMSQDPPARQYERSEYSPGVGVPAPFESMDLPFYGGQLEKANEGFMEVSYGDEATVEQLVQWWPAALEAEGWEQTSGGPTPSGGFGATYKRPDGGPGSLSIRPTGTLWTVILIAEPDGP